MLGIARRTPWVLGVVGWINLLADDTANEVRRRAGDPHFLGMQPLLKTFPDPDWIRKPSLDPALKPMPPEGLVWMLSLILPHQITHMPNSAAAVPTLHRAGSCRQAETRASRCHGGGGRREK